MWRQVRAIRPLRMAPVGHLVDLDNLTRWFIATVFCATNDAYQGPGQFRDPMRESAQWFWVNWDMDQSFRQPDQDTFWYLLSRTGKPRGRRPNEPRPRILVTLLDEDPEYRAYFQRVWTDVMNHVLTPAFLDERFEHYFAEASRLDLRDLAYLTPLKVFLQRRPTVAWQIATDWLRTGPAVACRIGGHARRGGHRWPARRAGLAGVLLPRHARRAVGATGTDVGLLTLGRQRRRGHGHGPDARRDVAARHRADLGRWRDAAAGALTRRSV